MSSLASSAPSSPVLSGGPRPLRVLALEPYDGGSHRAFLRGWRAASRHRFTILGLPPHHWKWRMRHAAITFADAVRARRRAGERWDRLVASSMLDLATFVGLVPELGALPSVVYFHENQLTYPVRREDPRDLHFAFTHLTTALAADAVWIASRYHRDELFAAVEALVARMPERRLDALPERLRRRVAVWPQGIEPFPAAEVEETDRAVDGPLRIVWAARWEHDKDPETFFAALDRLIARGVDFRVDVLGESFREVPPVFAEARARLGARVGRWGFVPRDEYRAALVEADVFVSTARHEFFGVAAAEACAAGCLPLLPRRLAYPELLEEVPASIRDGLFYDGSADDPSEDGPAERIARRLAELARSAPLGPRGAVRRAVERFTWPRLGRRLDQALEEIGRST